MDKYVKSRATIIAEIIEFKLSNLDVDTKELLINNNWGVTQEEFEKSDYPFELKNELLKEYCPKHDITSTFYDPLIRDVLFEDFSEYTNLELEHLYHELTGKRIVIKEIEKKGALLYECPCCCNKTLEERGQYFICPICDWEDDGLDYDHVSHCNGMRLSDAQNNYKRHGSIY